jgi:hypothetical protein
MTDDIEGEVQEDPVDAPEVEPPSEPDDTESAVRRGIEKQRERGPDGKFVKSEGNAAVDQAGSKGAAKGVATAAPAAEPGPKDETQPPKDAPAAIRPPPGFSVATKQAWDALPDHVKADIAKRETEIETGFQRYTGLSRFAEEAERNGTTLQNAVSDYVAVENELRKDPVSGVEFLFQKMGMNPINVLNAWFSRYAPQQGGNGQAPTAPQPQIDPNAIIEKAVEQARHGVRSEFQQEQINNDIAKFSVDPANRFFANVRPLMSRIVQAGKPDGGDYNLQEAYEAACWLNPEIRAILLEETRGGQDKAAVRTAAKAQNAAKAVTGAPSSNSHAGEPPRRQPKSTEEALRAAIARQRGAA